MPKGSQVALGISQIHSEGSQNPYVRTKSDLISHIYKSFYKDDSNMDGAEIEVSFMIQIVAPDFKVKVRDVKVLSTFFSLFTIGICPYFLPVPGRTGHCGFSPEQSSRDKRLYYMDVVMSATLLYIVS